MALIASLNDRLDLPRRRILWRTINYWIAVYEHPKTKDLITIRTLNKPTTKKRRFKVTGGLRAFKLIRLTKHRKEVIIVAKTAKKAPNKKKNDVVEDDDLEELEALEDLDDLEDEDVEDAEVVEDDDDDEDEDEDEDDSDEDDDEDEDEEEDEDDEEDEEPAPKKSKKAPAKSKSKKSRAREDGRVGTQEVAEHFGVDSRTLRMVLRRNDIPKNPESGRYDWKSLNDPKVVKIGKLIKGGAAKEAKQEGLERVKGSKKSKGTKKSKK